MPILSNFILNFLLMKSSFCLLLAFSFWGAVAQQHLTSGGKLKSEQAIMDIRHYKIALDVDIPRHRIKGYTIIELNLLKPASVLLFDLLDSFIISKLTVNGEKQPFVYQNNLITIHLNQIF